MNSSFYEIVGRFVLAAISFTIRTRYRTQLRVGAAAAIGAVVLGGYLAATREPPEG
jgi:hypothetical protein